MSKSSARRERQQQQFAERERSNRTFLLSIVVVIALVAVAVYAGAGGNTPIERVAPAAVQRSGTASALDVVVDAKSVALGHVPLDTTVTPTWKLVNRGTSVAMIGEPHAEVVEGCCPGPLQLGAVSLAPGEATELTFPLQMHAGMDGPHDFEVHVPVTRGEAKALLELQTTGHFSPQAPADA